MESNKSAFVSFIVLFHSAPCSQHATKPTRVVFVKPAEANRFSFHEVSAILAVAPHQGELDSVEKRQKVGQLFSRMIGNQMDAFVIHAWHRNQKKPKDGEGVGDKSLDDWFCANDEVVS